MRVGRGGATKSAPLALLALIQRSAWRDCPKRVGGACSVALRSTEGVLFDPYWPPCASQIHAKSVVRTLFGQSRKENTRKFAWGSGIS
jgi:hypothetical protein